MMNKNRILLVGALIALLASPVASADRWKGESGHGRHHGRHHHHDRHYHGGSHKDVYWDGNCKVERKWKGNGDYKEERHCKSPRYRRPGHFGFRFDPGIVLQGTVVIQ